MSREACGPDGSGKQPASSIRDVFSSLFSRDRSDSADGPAVLTAFRELPEGEDPLPDTRESDQGEHHSNSVVEPELVQVTRVETYSDPENEEEEEASRRGLLGPKGDEDEPRDEGAGACAVPVFRTHNFDRSCIENMLHAEKSRRKRPRAERNSASEGGEAPNGSGGKEGPASGPAGSEGQDDAAASPPEHAEHLEGTETGETKAGTTGSRGGPDTPEVPDQSAPRPDERSVDQTTSVSDHQTPETDAQPSDSPSFSSRGATPPSPPSNQMPALFSGLRVLKRGAVGEDRDTTAEIKQSEKDADLALLSLKKSVNKAKLHPKQNTPSPTKKQPAGGRTAATGQPANASGPRQDADANATKVSENGDDVPGEESTAAPEKRSTSDLAYETFRSFFGPRGAKKEKTDNVDLEAVKRKIKTDKENLKSIFERVSRIPSKELKSPTEFQVRVPPP